ncbi:hypothetical protein [Polymorphospora lycopeni]|uniref:Uncharacterized protein n=1 Tax=Polymorphospora lycopeni TaxID=3140240 RepID=A0ABV5CL60_9ACTN
MGQFTPDSTPTARQYGAVTLISTDFGTHIAIHVLDSSGIERDNLRYTNVDRDAARAHYAHLRALALDGLTATEIHDQLRLPQLIAVAKAEETAAELVVAEAERIVSGAYAQIAADMRPRTLATIKADFAANGLSRKPQVSRSKSGVETKPLSRAGQALIDRIARNGGTIVRARGTGISSTQLMSLAAKDLVDLHYDPAKLPRKVITGATLKVDGWERASGQARAEGQALRKAVDQ